MSSREQPYRDRDDAFAAFAEHVNRGKVETYRSFGLDAVMGSRGGPFFHDAYSERRSSSRSTRPG